jgi:LPS O-antigen subunit length determinant protein (WzzB/FepE family)
MERMMTTRLKNTSDHLIEVNPQQAGLGYSQLQDDEIDLVQLLLNLKQRWQQIVLIILVGTVLSIVIALMLPKVYHSSLTVSLPPVSVIATVNSKGLTEYTEGTLFKAYYDKVRSEAFLQHFVMELGYLSRLYPAAYIEDNTTRNEDALFAKFVKTFTVEIKEPVVAKGGFNANPTRIRLSLQHGDEALIVELLNHYSGFANTALFAQLTQQQNAERVARIDALKQKIALLKSHALTERKLLIAKIETDNSEEVSVLEQQKRIVILKAAADRATRIAKTQEALAIAKSLNIVHPTRLDNMNKGAGSSGEAKTSITLSNEQSLPLYLMGSHYLNTLIKSLKMREGDALFLTELNAINSNIEMVKNDQKLNALKTRQSDEPFIAGLPDLLNRIEGLRILPLEFNELAAFTLDKSALVSSKAVKPNRLLIVILGFVLSSFLALIVALVSAALANRRIEVA